MVKYRVLALFLMPVGVIYYATELETSFGLEWLGYIDFGLALIYMICAYLDGAYFEYDDDMYIKIFRSALAVFTPATLTMLGLLFVSVGLKSEGWTTISKNLFIGLTILWGVIVAWHVKLYSDEKEA